MNLDQELTLLCAKRQLGRYVFKPIQKLLNKQNINPRYLGLYFDDLQPGYVKINVIIGETEEQTVIVSQITVSKTDLLQTVPKLISQKIINSVKKLLFNPAKVLKLQLITT